MISKICILLCIPLYLFLSLTCSYNIPFSQCIKVFSDDYNPIPNTYVYNEKGKLIEKIEYLDIQGKNLSYRSYQYIYDENDRLIECHTYLHLNPDSPYEIIMEVN